MTAQVVVGLYMIRPQEFCRTTYDAEGMNKGASWVNKATRRAGWLSSPWALVQQRPPGKPYPGVFEFAGGKVGPGEGLVTALVREWKEELGVHIALQSETPIAKFTGNDGNGDYEVQLMPIVELDGEPRALIGQPFIGLVPLNILSTLPGTPSMPWLITCAIEHARRTA